MEAESQPKRISFASNGFEHHGSLLIPKPSKQTAVLFLRGGGITYPSIEIFGEWQKRLGGAGIPSLFFDFPGSGGWSTGNLADNTLERRTDWSQDALDHLIKAADIKKVIVVGSSMGADQAIFLLQRRPDIIKGIILSSASLYVDEVRDKAFGPAFSSALRRSHDYGSAMAVQIMKNAEIPFLVFYAEHESVIPEEVQKLYKAVPSAAEFYELKGVKHMYLSPKGKDEDAARELVYKKSIELVRSLGAS